MSDTTHLYMTRVASSLLALFMGFAIMVISVVLAERVAARIFFRTRGESDSGYLACNLLSSAVAAACGGYVTAIIAKLDPLRNSLMLAVVVLLFSALSALQLRGQQPLAYQFTLLVITPVAALAGGLFRIHQTGFRW